ncbi:MAG: hypothetical protein RR555_11610 [Bacteroidales bacterium]
MLKFIKEYIRNKTLRNKSVQTNATFVNLRDIRSIGFLYNISSPNFLEELKNIAVFLDKQGILYWGLAIETKKGFLPQMETADDMPDFLRELEENQISFVERLHLDWLGIPNSEKIDNFLKRDFDLFISLNNTGDFTLEYIIRDVKAKLIVGMQNIPGSRYTLVLEGENKATLGYTDYLQQVFHYLHVIKSNKAI